MGECLCERTICVSPSDLFSLFPLFRWCISFGHGEGGGLRVRTLQLETSLLWNGALCDSFFCWQASNFFEGFMLVTRATPSSTSGLEPMLEFL